MKASTILRAGLAAGTLGTLVAGSSLFATIAAADVTGYQTGYTYHQGLATNAGARLVAEARSGALTTGTSGNTAQSSTVSQSTANTSGVSASTPTSATVDTTGSTAVTPAADTNTAQAAAVQPAAANAATANTATPTTILASQPFMMALWVLLGLAVLALIAMGISAIVNAMNPNTDEETYTERRVSYQ